MDSDENIMTGNKEKYDIGLVCAINRNIGNNLTNYALYRYLSDLDYRVLLISNPWRIEGSVEKVIDSRFDLFMQLPYPDSCVFPITGSKWQLSDTNLLCGRFILGSDQVWRDMLVSGTDFFTCLDWVDSEKCKISYAASFGIGYFEGSNRTKKKMGYLLRRFQNISVREQSGVKLLDELCGIKAEAVLDPVFLCEREHYDKLAKRGKERLPEQRYVGAYLLDITEEKEEAVLEASGRVSSGIYAAVTEPDSKITKDVKLQLLSFPFIEEWLALIQNCDFFLTDSFHGLCFALIFQKQFCVIFEKKNWRGLSRIRSLLELLGLGSRLIENMEYRKIADLCEEKINYTKVNRILFRECKRSKNWLNNALGKKENHEKEYDVHDFCRDMCGSLDQEIRGISERYDLVSQKIRNELFVLSHAHLRSGIRKTEVITAAMQIVGWGTGDCFRRNIDRVKRFYDMKYVCDSSPEKWGKEMEGNVTCISPGMLSEMGDIMVIIMVDRASVAFQIAGELLRLGITSFDHIENWLSFVQKEIV